MLYLQSLVFEGLKLSQYNNNLEATCLFRRRYWQSGKRRPLIGPRSNDRIYPRSHQDSVPYCPNWNTPILTYSRSTILVSMFFIASPTNCGTHSNWSLIPSYSSVWNMFWKNISHSHMTFFSFSTHDQSHLWNRLIVFFLLDLCCQYSSSLAYFLPAIFSDLIPSPDCISHSFLVGHPLGFVAVYLSSVYHSLHYFNSNPWASLCTLPIDYGFSVVLLLFDCYCKPSSHFLCNFVLLAIYLWSRIVSYFVKRQWLEPIFSLCMSSDLGNWLIHSAFTTARSSLSFMCSLPSRLLH